MIKKFLFLITMIMGLSLHAEQNFDFDSAFAACLNKCVSLKDTLEDEDIELEKHCLEVCVRTYCELKKLNLDSRKAIQQLHHKIEETAKNSKTKFQQITNQQEVIINEILNGHTAKNKGNSKDN